LLDGDLGEPLIVPAGVGAVIELAKASATTGARSTVRP
jgi:hypothetical protein